MSLKQIQHFHRELSCCRSRIERHQVRHQPFADLGVRLEMAHEITVRGAQQLPAPSAHRPSPQVRHRLERRSHRRIRRNQGSALRGRMIEHAREQTPQSSRPDGSARNLPSENRAPRARPSRSHPPGPASPSCWRSARDLVGTLPVRYSHPGAHRSSARELISDHRTVR